MAWHSFCVRPCARTPCRARVEHDHVARVLPVHSPTGLRRAKKGLAGLSRARELRMRQRSDLHDSRCCRRRVRCRRVPRRTARYRRHRGRHDRCTVHPRHRRRGSHTVSRHDRRRDRCSCCGTRRRHHGTRRRRHRDRRDRHGRRHDRRHGRRGRKAGPCAAAADRCTQRASEVLMSSRRSMR